MHSFVPPDRLQISAEAMTGSAALPELWLLLHDQSRLSSCWDKTSPVTQGTAAPRSCSSASRSLTETDTQHMFLCGSATCQASPKAAVQWSQLSVQESCTSGSSRTDCAAVGNADSAVIATRKCHGLLCWLCQVCDCVSQR